MHGDESQLLEAAQGDAPLRRIRVRELEGSDNALIQDAVGA